MQTERLLYHSDKVGLGNRLLLTPFGLLFIWCAFLLAVRSEIIGAVISGVFGLLFLSIWVYQWRMSYDPSRRQLVFRSWGTWRINLSGAEAVFVKEVRKSGGITGGGPYVEIGLRYREGGDKWLLGQPLGDPNCVALIISEAAGLPIIQVEKTIIKQTRGSMVWGTVIGGGIVIGTFFIREPLGLLWIIRCLAIIWLVGWWRNYLTKPWRRNCKP